MMTTQTVGFDRQRNQEGQPRAHGFDDAHARGGSCTSLNHQQVGKHTRRQIGQGVEGEQR
jgi:hypothetical protein